MTNPNVMDIQIEHPLGAFINNLLGGSKATLGHLMCDLINDSGNFLALPCGDDILVVKCGDSSEALVMAKVKALLAIGAHQTTLSAEDLDVKVVRVFGDGSTCLEPQLTLSADHVVSVSGVALSGMVSNKHIGGGATNFSWARNCVKSSSKLRSYNLTSPHADFVKHVLVKIDM